MFEGQSKTKEHIIELEFSCQGMRAGSFEVRPPKVDIKILANQPSAVTKLIVDSLGKYTGKI